MSVSFVKFARFNAQHCHRLLGRVGCQWGEAGSGAGRKAPNTEKARRLPSPRWRITPC